MSPEVEIAHAAREEIELASQNAEQDCRLPTELIRKLGQKGLFTMMIPTDYGGTQREPQESLDMIEALAYADSAVGWCAMIYTTTALLGSFLPERWAREIYGINESGGTYDCPIGAGAAAPSGRGKVVDGGISVTGRWAWGSGSHHADWICGGALIEEEDGDVRRHANGEPAVYVMFFKQEEVQLHTNWNPSGLRGTGSVDFEVRDVFVPEARWTVLGASRRQVDAPLYRFPFFGYFAAAVASVPLGIARRAIDDFETLARAKVPTANKSTLSTSSITQIEFGQAESLAQGSAHYLRSVVQQAWQRINSDGSATLEDRRALRLAASQATLMATQAVDKLYNAAGGSALQGDVSLQKHFRDIHAATQHRMVSPEILRMAAAVRLDDQPGQL
ncbi:MAG: hypothetical protein GKR90_08470 [Pseudomonadales bacterium]|nr:hypothetical protein [Pseudomonadales bacterium]